MKHWKRDYFVLFSGQALSLISSSMLQMGLIFVVTAQKGSATALSLMMLAAFLPYALFGPLIGVYVDRLDRKATMMVADWFIALMGLVLVVMGTDQLVVILIVLFFRSLGQAFHEPALSATTPLIVPEEALTEYAGYTQSLASLSFILSPVAAVLVYGMFGLNAIIFFDAFCALIASFAVFMTRIPKLNQDDAKKSLISEMRLGLKGLLTDSGLSRLVFFGSLYMVVFMPVAALFPLMSTQHFRGGNREIAIVEVVFALGMLAGGLVLSRFNRDSKRALMLCGAVFGSGLTLVLSGLLGSDQFWHFVVICFLMGVTMPVYMGLQMVFFQERLQPEIMGRVFALTGSITALATPLGLGITSLVADRMSTPMWFMISGILVVGLAGLMAFNQPLRSLDGGHDEH